VVIESIMLSATTYFTRLADVVDFRAILEASDRWHPDFCESVDPINNIFRRFIVFTVYK
jgi:hypothetical protein